MPPMMRRALLLVGLFSLLFLLISWGVIAYSVFAPPISSVPDHPRAGSASQCLACHAGGNNAPPLPHPTFPTCGFCHR